LRVWALTAGEVGVPRLPGGALVDDMDELVDAGPSNHDNLCSCPGPIEHRDERWYRDVESTLIAARDRDGATLMDIIGRAVFGDRPPTEVFSYVATIASTSCSAIVETGTRREIDALLHMLGYYGHTPEHWSVCGYVYRLVAAILTSFDMGSDDVAGMVIGPEIDALRSLDQAQWLRAFAVAGKVYGSIMVDEPGVKVARIGDAVQIDGRAAYDRERTAARGTRIAGEAALLFRSDDDDALAAMIGELSMGDLAIAVFGMCHLLASRIRDLWG
jgi:hypothetical protein